MKRFLLFTACIVLLCFTLPGLLYCQDTPPPGPESSPSSPEPAYKISVKGSSCQGGILFVSVQGSTQSQEAECTWRKKKYVLVWQRNKLGVLLPVALDTPPGAYTLSVDIRTRGASDTKTLTRVIPVKAHNYGVQHLWLSQEQLSRYDDPQSEKDNNNIHKALSEYTTGITWSSDFIWPVNGYTSTQFGLKRLYNDDPEPEFHRGIDISVGAGTPVVASQAGIVSFTGKNLLLHGNTVVLDHGKGIGTLYIHMNSIKVKKGERVEQGDIIGTVGSTGVATGPHLHWAAYVHDEPMDPHLLFNLPPEWLDR